MIDIICKAKVEKGLPSMSDRDINITIGKKVVHALYALSNIATKNTTLFICMSRNRYTMLHIITHFLSHFL